MSKSLRITFLCFLTLCSGLYVNFNVPVFQQFFAFLFYKKIEAVEVYPVGFTCVSVNVVRGSSFLDRNQYILYGGSVSVRNYTFILDSNKYRVQKRTYTGPPFSCDEPNIKYVYYFPLNPEWSVAYKSLPEIPYFLTFIFTTFCLASFFAFYFHQQKTSKTNQFDIPPKNPHS